MKVFLSFSSNQRTVAERISLALLAEKHDVFFDRSSLKRGEAFDAPIRHEIQKSDLFVFLITPDSVAKGSYCLSELEFAREKWPHPKGRVLPVMLIETEFERIPVYAKAVTILPINGDAAAEIAAEIEKLAG